MWPWCSIAHISQLVKWKKLTTITKCWFQFSDILCLWYFPTLNYLSPSQTFKFPHTFIHWWQRCLLQNVKMLCKNAIHVKPPSEVSDSVHMPPFLASNSTEELQPPTQSSSYIQYKLSILIEGSCWIQFFTILLLHTIKYKSSVHKETSL